MKIIDNVIEIFNQYELKPLEFPTGHEDIYSYLREFPEKSVDYDTNKSDWYFIEKYRKNIPEGHYGFAIGMPIIPEWNDILEKIIDLCIGIDRDFEIRQIKSKFGRICFYVGSEIIEDIFDVEIFIENKLYDKALIY